MRKVFAILLLFVSVCSWADGDFEPCLCSDCPNPAKGCKFTIDEGFVSRTIDLWGNVRVTTDRRDADILVYVTDGGADLVVTWVEGKAYGCGQWHRVDKGEHFSICFVNSRCEATLVITYGDAIKLYDGNAVPF